MGTSAATPSGSPPPDRTGESFPTTLWSRIVPGEGADAKARAAALDTLARRYERPIRAYLETAVARDAGEAADLAQAFFVWMIESRFVEKAVPARGRFRAFLKTALRHFAADAARRDGARKRGGDRAFVSLGPGDADASSPPFADAASLPADEVLDREWRAGLIREAIARTEAQFAGEERRAIFAVFRDYFLDPAQEIDYRALATRHGVTPVDVSNYLARAKKALREHLHALVLDTVRAPEDIHEEMRWLFGKEGA